MDRREARRQACGYVAGLIRSTIQVGIGPFEVHDSEQDRARFVAALREIQREMERRAASAERGAGDGE